MRDVPPRFRALLGIPNHWVNVVEWSNDGGRSWSGVNLISGSVTCSAKSQIRWTADLSLSGVKIDIDGLHVNSQLRIYHGIAGLPLLAMGRYRVSQCSRSSDTDVVTIKAESFESYAIRARFPQRRTLASDSGQHMIARLVTELLPNATFDFRVDDQILPKITEDRDRWAVIDGKRSSGTSISRALAARTFCGPAGEWITAPVPSLSDPVVWRASVGEMKISDTEDWTDEGLANAIVVSNGTTFTPRMAVDQDPNSATNASLPIEEGGMGLWPEFYDSSLITGGSQADRVAQSMLAERIGVQQQVSASQLHDPTIEPGDVGIIETATGNRLVMPDAITYSLQGEPLSMETRSTLTRYTGLTYAAPDDSDLDEGSLD